MLIDNPFDISSGGPGRCWIIDEPELHFGEYVLVPDIVGWRHETLPEIPQDHLFTVAPSWVCEVLSPSTGNTDRTEKMPIYANAGVCGWLIPLTNVFPLLSCLGSNQAILTLAAWRMMPVWRGVHLSSHGKGQVL